MISNVTWSEPESSPRLGKRELHIWRARIDVSSAVQTTLTCHLDVHEQQKASQFVFERDRHRYQAAHGIVREILGHYLRQPPSELRFVLAPHGKPMLAKEASRDLRFNFSRAEGLFLLAVAVGREVGIDVERIRADFADESLETTVLTERERAALPHSLDRDREFFLRWTCKEAYIKARGQGLQIPLKSFEVLFDREHSPRLRCSDRTRWHVASFLPSEHFVATVVAEGTDTRIGFWNWRWTDFQIEAEARMTLQKERTEGP
jgi:4'-phosphopantetheinyl transferase